MAPPAQPPSVLDMSDSEAINVTLHRYSEQFRKLRQKAEAPIYRQGQFDRAARYGGEVHYTQEEINELMASVRNEAEKARDGLGAVLNLGRGSTYQQQTLRRLQAQFTSLMQDVPHRDPSRNPPVAYANRDVPTITENPDPLQPGPSTHRQTATPGPSGSRVEREPHHPPVYVGPPGRDTGSAESSHPNTTTSPLSSPPPRNYANLAPGPPPHQSTQSTIPRYEQDPRLVQYAYPRYPHDDPWYAPNPRGAE